MVHYSLVSYTKDEIIQDDDGITINVIASIKGERNDAVEYGLGAMDQKTNEEAKYNPYPNEHSARIIVPGRFEQDSFERKNITTGVDIIIGRLKGETTTTTQAYRFKIKNFTVSEAKKWLKDHDIKYILFEPATEKENKGEAMTKEEILEKLKALKANAEITLLDIAEALGLSKQLLTDEHTEALKLVNSFKEIESKDPVTELKSLREQVKANSGAVRNAELDKAFGNDADKKNYLRQYAEKQAGDLLGEELEKRINEIKEDPIAKQLAKDRTDYTTDTNAIIGSIEKTNTTDNTGKKTGIKVDKV